MSIRNILTLIGLCMLAAGPVLMHHVPSSAIYTVGEVLCALGPVLIGYRTISKDEPAPAVVGTPATDQLKGRLVGYPQAAPSAPVAGPTESWAGTSSSLPTGLYALAPDGTKTPLPDPQTFRQPLGQPGAGE